MCCSDLTKANLLVRVSQVHTDQQWVQTELVAVNTHAAGSNYTTLEVMGNGGKKMFCESRGDF